MYPVELAPVYAGNYERYLVETADQVLPYLIGRGDMERLLYLTEHKMIPRPVPIAQPGIVTAMAP